MSHGHLNIVGSHRVGGNRKCNQQSTNADQKNGRKSVFDCHLLPVANGNQKHCFYGFFIYVPR